MHKHVEVFEQMIGYVKDELGVHFDSSDFKKHSDEVLEILKTPSIVSFVLTEHSPDDIEPINWSDKESVINEVKYNGYMLAFASDELKDDFDVVISAVSNTPSALQYASINQMMRAVNDNKNNLFYCSEEVKKIIRKLSA